MQIMITNGGTHPPDKWAEITTDAILNLIQIADGTDESVAAPARAAKRDLRPKLFDALLAAHTSVQKSERDECKKRPKRSAETHLDVMPHLPPAAKAVDDLLAATPFAEHFAKPDVKNVIHQMIGQHFADSMHIERQWLNRQKGA